MIGYALGLALTGAGCVWVSLRAVLRGESLPLLPAVGLLVGIGLVTAAYVVLP